MSARDQAAPSLQGTQERTYAPTPPRLSTHLAIAVASSACPAPVAGRARKADASFMRCFVRVIQITCLYDLDIVFDPVTHAFNEVYLYEELMEADLHAIVRTIAFIHA